MTSTTQQELVRSYALLEGALATELQQAVSAGSSSTSDVQLVLADLIGTIQRHHELADLPTFGKVAAWETPSRQESGVIGDLQRWQERLDRDRALGSSSASQACGELAQLAARVAVSLHTPA